MKINWGHLDNIGGVSIQSVLETEYSFRTIVTKLFLQNVTEDLHDYIEDLQFDICLLNKRFSISEKTPEPIHSTVKEIISNHLPNHKDLVYKI